MALQTLAQRDSTKFLPSVIDRVARNNPEKPFMCVPKTDRLCDGFEDVSYGKLADSINRAAGWLDEKIGMGTSTGFDTVAYIGPSDLRVPVLMVAAMKTGRKLFCIGRNVSAESALILIEQTSAVALIHATTSRDRARLDELSSSNESLLRFEVPTLDFWTNNSKSLPNYISNQTWDEAANNPVVVFHTSGTTCTPKPVTFTNATLMSIANEVALQHQGIKLSHHDLTGRRAYCAYALLHIAGFLCAFIMPVYYDYVAISVPLRMRTVEAFDAGASDPRVSVAWLFPSLMAEISQRPKSMEIFESLELVWWGTAPLDAALGEKLSEKVDLRMRFGSTEMCSLPLLPAGRRNWNYIRLPDWAGVEFQLRDEKFYEMVFVRRESAPQSIFTVFPEQWVCFTKDLFSPHPTETGLWRYEGRMDDLVKLSTGQSVYVNPLETIMQEPAEVRAVLVAGHGRPRLCALVEMVPYFARKASQGIEAHDEVVELLWPAIQKANRLAPAETLLHRDAITICLPSQTFPRLEKGSIDRRKALSLFETEIDRIYGH